MSLISGVPHWLSAGLKHQLHDAGFTWFGRTARRVTNTKIDVIDIELIRKALCHKWALPYGSITLGVGCFLPFVPSMERSKFHCGRDSTAQPRHLDCTIRFGIERKIEQKEVKNAKNIWFVDQNKENVAVLDDMKSAISDKVLKFFQSNDDISNLLECLQHEKDNMGGTGIWNIGKEGSFKRLYLIGFTALEMGDWELADRSLRDCQYLIESKNLSINQNIVGCIRHAITLAYNQQNLR
ncbi:hypothetical protein [Nitrospirillum sp. BR 11163]|uniref:hypothetical protein n=1 Tax=Nitrospirillum sp. BR 11163 TaxID=3104323 RepID=UPI002AFF1BB7|nr:hypothetical protein [Nitrospirillum sp. BR 11163]MEA1677473.1 hypothetical protein [Nitrospirillum sp. BR 11163]